MIDIKTRVSQIMAQDVLKKSNIPAPAVNYRQGAVPYSSLPTSRADQIAPTVQPTIPAGRSGVEFLGKPFDPTPQPDKVRPIDVVREVPEAMWQTFSYPVKKLLNFTGKSSAHALNLVASPVETIAAKIGKDPSLITTGDLLNDASERWANRASKIGNVFTDGGQGLGVFDEDAWNKLAEPLAKGVMDKNKKLPERITDFASLVDVSVMRLFADPLWFATGKIPIKSRALTLGEQAIEEQNSLRLLGLRNGATAEEINTAFRARAKTTHPDILFRNTKPSETELLKAQKEFSDIVAARNTLIKKFKTEVKPTITQERTQPTTPTQPVSVTTPATSGARQLPAGTQTYVPPVDSTQVGFQMVDPKKQAELIKAQKVLQTAIESRRSLIDSGRADDKTKIAFKQLTGAIAVINKQISDLSGQQIKVSGPVLTPEQQANAVKPTIATPQPAIKQPIVQPAIRQVAEKPIVRPTQEKEIVKPIKSETKQSKPATLPAKKPKLSPKEQQLYDLTWGKNPQTVIDDLTKAIPLEKNPAWQREYAKKIEKIKALMPTEKPTSRRALATEKRNVRLTKQQEETARLKENAAIRAKNEAKPKSYKEMLAKAEAKKIATKAAEGTKAKVQSVREYLLEQKIKQKLKGGEMTAEEAATARAKGKVNLRTNEIEFKKGKGSIDTAEVMGEIKSNDEFKLFEHGYRLVKKYTKLTGKTEGVVSEKNVPRGAAASASETGTTRFKSLNSISNVVHEITHIIDRASGLRNKITDPGIIADLTDVYRKYYLQDHKVKKVDVNLAIKEGLAAFIENYALHPTKMKTDYPVLYREFLSDSGIYHDPLFNELISDTQNILKQYQGLDANGKIMARIVDNARSIDVKSFYNVKDKINAFLFDIGKILGKADRYVGTEHTPESTALWLETYRLTSNVFAHNVLSENKRFSKETYLKLTEDGSFIEAHPFNWGSIVKSLGSESNVSQYSGYLLARDTHFNYKELADLNKTIAENKTKIKELTQQFESEQNEDILNNINALKEENSTLQGYATQKQKVLTNRNIPENLASEDYNLNKEKYSEQDKMFDTLVRDNLDTLYLARLIKPEFYNYLISKKGYAPTYVDYIDEIAGVPELSDALLDNVSYTIRGKKVNSLVARTGSEKAIINPLIQAMINDGKNLPKAIQQIIYNKFGEFANQLPDYAINEVEYNPLMKDRSNTIVTVDESFKKHAFKIDKNLKKVFDTSFTPATMGIFRKVLAKSSKLFTASTTGIYSAFAVVNVPIDSMSAFIQSKNRLIPIIDSLKSSIDLFQKNPDTKKYVQEYFDIMGFSNTAIGSIYYSETLQDSLRLIDINYKKSVGGQIESGFDKSINVLSFPSQATEMLTRLTEYINSRKAGNSQIVAREDSITVSAPFFHRGYIYPWIQPAVYVNAGLQVLDMTLNTMHRMYQEVKGTKNSTDKTNVIGRFGLMTAALTAVALTEIGILLKNLKEAKTDEEKRNAQKAIIDYNNLTMYERANFVRSSIGSDTPSIMRVPSNYSLISNMIAMVIADNYIGSNFTAKEYASMFVESLPLPRSWTAYLPYFPKQLALIQLGYKDFPQLKKLEQDYMKYLPSNERSYATTPEFAKWLGDTSVAKALNISPIKIQEYMNMFGRGAYKQFFGEWDSTKNPLQNIYNSYIATFKNALVKQDYLFVGREFEQFYNDKNVMDYEISSGKKTYNVVKSEGLKTSIVNKMQRDQLYNKVADFMTDIRNIDSAGITVPKEYINSIYNVIGSLNRGKDDDALKSLLQLNTSSDFINFINNSKRTLEEKKTESIKAKFDKSQTNLGIRIANAAELDKPFVEREIISANYINDTLRSRGMPLTTTNAKVEVYAKNIKVKQQNGKEIANNNPGNLEFHGQPNAIRNGRWAKFSTPEIGFRALMKDVQAKQSRGLTIKELIYAYAPPNENDTEKYIADINRLTNSKRNDKASNLDPIYLARQIALLETGSIIEER